MNENEISEAVRECAAKMIGDDGTVTVCKTLSGKEYVVLNAKHIQQTINNAVAAKDAEIERLKKSMIVLREQNYCSMCGVVFDELRARIGISDQSKPKEKH